MLAGAVREFDPRCAPLLGLDFDQFTKCVVLPQGRFAAFLQASSGERGAILGALLGLGRYDRMAKAAHDRAGRAQGLREALEQERSRGAGPRRRSARRRSAGAATPSAAWSATSRRPARSTIASAPAIEECRREGDAARSCIGRARPGAGRPEDRPARARHRAGRGGACTSSLPTRTRPTARATAAANALDALPPLEQLTSALEAHVDRATVATRIANGAELQTGLVRDASDARDALVAAQQAVVDAQAAVDEANRVHAHAELRARPRRRGAVPGV